MAPGTTKRMREHRAQQQYWAQRSLDDAKFRWPDWDPLDEEIETGAAQMVMQSGDSHVEIILGMNWALLPKGLESFYSHVKAQQSNIEIAYDLDTAAFHIKCIRENESETVALVRTILEKIVEQEEEAILERKSDSLLSTDEWFKERATLGTLVQVEETAAFNQYPPFLAACAHRTIWPVPSHLTDRGITVDALFSDRLISEIQHLTGASLMKSCDGRTIYVGSQEPEVSLKASKKLDTRATWFSLLPIQPQNVMGILLYNEGEQVAKGEYRFLADRNRRLLETYVLDDWYYGGAHYEKIFKRGAIVRLNPGKEPWKSTPSISDNIQMDSSGQAEKRFSAFLDWGYKTKEPSERVLVPLFITNSPPTTEIRPSEEASHGPDGYSNRQCTITKHVVAQYEQSEPPSAVKLDQKVKHWVSGIPEATSQLSDKAQDLTKEDCPSPQLESVNSTKHEETSNPSPGHLSPHEPHTRGLDPFRGIWQTALAELKSSLPRLKVSDDSPSLKPTMNQKAGKNRGRGRKDTKELTTAARTQTALVNAPVPAASLKVAPSDFDPVSMKFIKASLVELLKPLRMFPGQVVIQAELGRMAFLNVKKSDIQHVGDDGEERYFPLNDMKKSLTKRHTEEDDMVFTSILSGIGPDMDYIRNSQDENGTRMFRPNHRRTVYEFLCLLEDQRSFFMIDVEFDNDAKDFKFHLREAKPDRKVFGVHCTKRAWDFRLVLCSSQRFDASIYHDFASELVKHLEIQWTSGDVAPDLNFTVQQTYGIRVDGVRVRNIASYFYDRQNTNPLIAHDTLKLEIAEVLDLAGFIMEEAETHLSYQFSLRLTKSKTNAPPMWYEAAVRSKTLSMALMKNMDLEIGDEVEWDAEKLIQTEAVDGLVQTAATLVKRMDRVGRWNSNEKFDELEDLLPKAKPAENGVVEQFW
ncbi:hypothetical protein F5Y16DRAFT_423214 [Xylariaceae sp. FL0255]|nr:hypothetical protein F5Y16DRAFT_423214 [Xylariaceae sp. FL0255]